MFVFFISECKSKHLQIGWSSVCRMRHTVRRLFKYSPYDSVVGRAPGACGRDARVSPAQARKEEHIILPKTLISGRYDEKTTMAQRLAEKEARSECPDARFSQKATDFRQIQDPDPMSPLFGESKRTHRVRLREWQRQFEKENADTWLPYERTNFVTRNFLPNFLVKYLVSIRDVGGVNGWKTVTIAWVVLSFLILGFMRVTRGTYKDAQEVSNMR